MKKVITSILTDKTVRSSASVEGVLMKQAVASPWFNAEQVS